MQKAIERLLKPTLFQRSKGWQRSRLMYNFFLCFQLNEKHAELAMDISNYRKFNSRAVGMLNDAT